MWHSLPRFTKPAIFVFALCPSFLLLTSFVRFAGSHARIIASWSFGRHDGRTKIARSITWNKLSEDGLDTRGNITRNILSSASSFPHMGIKLWIETLTNVSLLRHYNELRECRGKQHHKLWWLREVGREGEDSLPLFQYWGIAGLWYRGHALAAPNSSSSSSFPAPEVSAFIWSVLPAMMSGKNATTSRASFQLLYSANARHATTVLSDNTIVPRRHPVAWHKTNKQTNKQTNK